MKEAIDFVKKAFNANSHIDAYRYVCLKDGSIQCSNGIFSMSAPVAISESLTPNGKDFFKAISYCGDKFTLSVTSDSKLLVKSGRFRAKIECLAGIYPRLLPEGQKLPESFNLGENLSELQPIFQEDNNHLWANGVLINGQQALCTNNLILVEKWLPFMFPYKVNIPVATIKALIDINEEIESLQITSNRVTFNFEGGRWLSTGIILADWPDVSNLFQTNHKASPYSDELFEAVKNLKEKNVLVTLSHNEITNGSFSYDVPDTEINGVFDSETLFKAMQMSCSIGLATEDKNRLFFGKNLRGLIVGRVE